MNESAALRHCLRPVMRFKREMVRRKDCGWNWPVIWSFVFVFIFWSLFFSIACHAQVVQPARVAIDLKKIAMIESSGNPRAWRKADDSRGLYQITPICLKEYNAFHPQAAYSMDDLWSTSISTLIAKWYLTVRIPQLLKHYRIKDTARNRIIAYNAGISCLSKNKPLPRTTRIYLAKYFSH